MFGHHHTPFSDGGNWIDPLNVRERLHDQRIVDYYHAASQLHEAAPAATGQDSPETFTLADQLEDYLSKGEVDRAVLESARSRVDPVVSGATVFAGWAVGTCWNIRPAYSMVAEIVTDGNRCVRAELLDTQVLVR
jgi:hypothetical protein